MSLVVVSLGVCAFRSLLSPAHMHMALVTWGTVHPSGVAMANPVAQCLNYPIYTVADRDEERIRRKTMSKPPPLRTTVDGATEIVLDARANAKKRWDINRIRIVYKGE